MMKSVVNWGVISCAGIAESSTIPAIIKAKNSCLYAISSRSKEKLAKFKEKFNPVKAYASYDEVLDDPNVDAVYIPLPNSLHCEWVIKAAKKKKHILCEKPLGISPKEVLEMDAVCKENDVILMEAFAFRFSPLAIKVKSLVDEGAIGKVNFIESHFNFIMRDLQNVRLIKDLSGGVTYDVGCYNINVIRYIAGGEPVSINAIGHIGEDSNVDESSLIAMQFENGINTVSYCSFNCINRSEYTIVGDKGIIHVGSQFNHGGQLKIILKRKTGIEEVILDTPDNYMLEVEQFGRCILENEKPLVSMEDALGNAIVIEEALKQIYKK